jgi:2'-5' RNA ligase
MIRTFIAIELPEQIKTALGEIQNDLRRTAADVSWTKPAIFI